MTPQLFSAVLALIGTIVGSFGGIMAANRLTNFRIEQLEERVRKHNNLIERMVIVEQSVKSAHHRIDEIIEERTE